MTDFSRTSLPILECNFSFHRYSSGLCQEELQRLLSSKFLQQSKYVSMFCACQFVSYLEDPSIIHPFAQYLPC